VEDAVEVTLVVAELVCELVALCDTVLVTDDVADEVKELEAVAETELVAVDVAELVSVWLTVEDALDVCVLETEPDCDVVRVEVAVLVRDADWDVLTVEVAELVFDADTVVVAELVAVDVTVPDCVDVPELVPDADTVDVPEDDADDVWVLDGEVTSQRRYDSSRRPLMKLLSLSAKISQAALPDCPAPAVTFSKLVNAVHSIVYVSPGNSVIS
jgi:hypothetical protein